MPLLLVLTTKTSQVELVPTIPCTLCNAQLADWTELALIDFCCFSAYVLYLKSLESMQEAARRYLAMPGFAGFMKEIEGRVKRDDRGTVSLESLMQKPLGWFASLHPACPPSFLPAFAHP